jgi:hypothetical protein
VEGPEEKRRRISGTITTFPLDDTVLITTPGVKYGTQWTQVSPEIKEGRKSEGFEPVPPKPPDRVTATTWEKILTYAKERPLVKLQLVAAKPAAAASLTSLVVPLGPDQLTLSLTVGGTLKEGGSVNFAANDIKPNHPIKPLQIAQTLFNSAGDAATFEADLTLHFGQTGRTGLEESLKTLSENLPEGITPSATFEKPAGGGE